MAWIESWIWRTQRDARRTWERLQWKRQRRLQWFRCIERTGENWNWRVARVYILWCR